MSPLSQLLDANPHPWLPQTSFSFFCSHILKVPKVGRAQWEMGQQKGAELCFFSSSAALLHVFSLGPWYQLSLMSRQVQPKPCSIARREYKLPSRFPQLLRGPRFPLTSMPYFQATLLSISFYLLLGVDPFPLVSFPISHLRKMCGLHLYWRFGGNDKEFPCRTTRPVM